MLSFIEMAPVDGKIAKRRRQLFSIISMQFYSFVVQWISFLLIFFYFLSDIRVIGDLGQISKIDILGLFAQICNKRGFFSPAEVGNQTTNLVGKNISLFWVFLLCAVGHLVMPTWFNLQILTSTFGITIYYGIFMQ